MLPMQLTDFQLKWKNFIKKNGSMKFPESDRKSEKDILRAISEFREGKGKTTKMLLPYAGEIAEQVLEYLRKNKDVEKAETLGSMRRMKPLVGDIDIAVATKKPKEVIEYFVSYPR